MTVLLVIQVIVVVAMIGVILMQRSSNDGFTGGGSGGMDSVMSGRSSANLLTRTTSILATIFIVNSLILAYMASHAERSESLIGEFEAQQEDSQPMVPETEAPAPVEPAVPAVE